MITVFLTGVLLVAGGQPGTSVWYQKQADEAIALAQKSKKAEAMSLINELRKKAEEQNSKDWQLWVELKKARCEYFLGELTQSIATLEKIEPLKNFQLRYVVVRDLGDAHLESGNPEKAERYLKEAGMDKKFDPTERASIRLKLVQCQVAQTRFDEARVKLADERKALDGLKTEADPEEWACLDARWNILQSGLDVEARNPLRGLIRLDATQKNLKRFPLSPEPIDLRFRCHIGLAADYWLVARFADADAQLTLAEKIVPSVKTERNLASIKNARAALLIEKVSQDMEGDYQAAAVLASLNKAQANLEAALGHHKKTGSGADFLTATIDLQLSQVHELRGRVMEAQDGAKDAKPEFEKARDRCEKSLKFRNGAFKADNDLVLEARLRKTWVDLRLGNTQAAQVEGVQTLKLFDAGHKKTDLDRGRYLHVLFQAEDRLGNTAAAIKYAQEHRRMVDDGMGTLLAGLSASEQIQFFRKWDTPALNASLRMAIQHADDPKLMAASAEWLINGKAKLAEVLAAQIKAARQGDRTAFVKFQKSVQRQAFLMYGEPTTDYDDLQREYLFEESTKRSISEAAAKQFGPEPRWYTLAEIQDNLKADELYVGVYCLSPREGARRVYYAWLVGRQGAVQTVELGDAATIDDLVKVFVREQERVPLIAPGEEKQAEQYLRRNCLEELSRHILHPILKRTDGQKKRWILSPDGPLWNIPWAALLSPEGRYAVEDLTFRYAVSGQDLVARRTAPAKGEPLVLGDPWFNYPDTDRQHLRKAGLDPLRLPWDRLENSRRECEMVVRIMEEFKLMPERAFGLVQKRQLLDLPRVPRLVYLSTHAYGTLSTRVNVDDPLLSCGLAFAGWNYLPPANDSSLPGMMTGSEVLGVDLSGTELVVLASCAAGKEELTYGQSPANLRHAFHLAGARAVVSALWGINDRATQELMEPFLESVLQPNADKATALREAQQQSIRYLRMYRDHSHPFYWAAFTISGN